MNRRRRPPARLKGAKADGMIGIVFDNRKRRVRVGGDVAGLIKRLGLLREEVVVKVNGRLAPETRKLSPSDRVEVIKVVFGG